MKSRARKRRLLQHTHPEHGLASTALVEAHRNLGVATGRYEAERARSNRAQLEVSRLLKEHSVAAKALHDFRFPRGQSAFYQAQYDLLKFKKDFVADGLSRARQEALAASLSSYQAYTDQVAAGAQLISMRWWEHQRKKIQL